MISDSFVKDKYIYFIGIGGISMSSIALILKSNGYKVKGSDINKTFITKNLEDNGIIINYSQIKKNITKDVCAVVYTSAINLKNEEILEAKELNIPIFNRAEVLSFIMSKYKDRINIAGSHGKTTTTSMISKILLDNNYNPTITVGGNLKDINGTFHIGDSNIFVTEACEYTDSFLKFCPNISIITNVKAEHLDYFKTEANMRLSFKKFINLLSKDGLLVINGEIDNLNELISDCQSRIITYGMSESSLYYSKNVKLNENGYYSYDLYKKNVYIGNIILNVLGLHNVENSVGAIALLLEYGLDFKKIKDSLEKFMGVDRRLEFMFTKNKIRFFDDYAHHPDEINASIRALKNLKHNKLYVIFQPHTYTRTKEFFNEFVSALLESDIVVLVDIYAAREKDDLGISSKDITNKINSISKNKSYYASDFDAASKYIIDNAKENDIVVAMGAGDVNKIINIIKENLNNIN